VLAAGDQEPVEAVAADRSAKNREFVSEHHDLELLELA
jgi:hypothetical protein